MSKSKSAPVAKAPAPKSAKPTKLAPRTKATKEARRLWLSYPPKQITQPVIWQMSQRFPVVFDIRQASVTDEIGILCLELDGSAADLDAAIAWLRKAGVRVEPVELSAMES